MARTLNLVGRVHTNLPEQGEDTSNKVPISEVVQSLEKMNNKERFFYVDLSFTCLGNDDMEDVVALVKMLPNCQLVNLTGLWINAKAFRAIRQLLRLPKMAFVIVCLTELSSSLSSHVYDVLTKRNLQKLVFLESRRELEKVDWHSMVHNEDKRKVVKSAHEYFFDKYPCMAKKVADTIDEALGIKKKDALVAAVVCPEAQGPTHVAAACPEAQAPTHAVAACAEAQAPTHAVAACPEAQAPNHAVAACPEAQACTHAAAAWPDAQAPHPALALSDDSASFICCSLPPSPQADVAASPAVTVLGELLASSLLQAH